jgi:Protein of unknown function (DUF2933)
MTHQPDPSPVHHDQSEHAPPPPSFWRSRAGIYLIVALITGGLLLGYEHRVHLLGSGLLIWIPLLLCVGMHFFMHGGHGGHSSHGKRGDK